MKGFASVESLTFFFFFAEVLPRVAGGFDLGTGAELPSFLTTLVTTMLSISSNAKAEAERLVPVQNRQISICYLIALLG